MIDYQLSDNGKHFYDVNIRISVKNATFVFNSE